MLIFYYYYKEFSIKVSICIFFYFYIKFFIYKDNVKFDKNEFEIEGMCCVNFFKINK